MYVYADEIRYNARYNIKYTESPRLAQIHRAGDARGQSEAETRTCQAGLTVTVLQATCSQPYVTCAGTADYMSRAGTADYTSRAGTTDYTSRAVNKAIYLASRKIKKQ